MIDYYAIADALAEVDKLPKNIVLCNGKKRRMMLTTECPPGPYDPQWIGQNNSGESVYLVSVADDEMKDPSKYWDASSFLDFWKEKEGQNKRQK